MDGLQKKKCSKNRNFGEIIILCVIVYNDNNISHGTIELCDSHACKTMNARTHTLSLSLSMLPSPSLPKGPLQYSYYQTTYSDSMATCITTTPLMTQSPPPSSPSFCCPPPAQQLQPTPRAHRRVKHLNNNKKAPGLPGSQACRWRPRHQQWLPAGRRGWERARLNCKQRGERRGRWWTIDTDRSL